jgi:hypothetical protein
MIVDLFRTVYSSIHLNRILLTETTFYINIDIYVYI